MQEGGIYNICLGVCLTTGTAGRIARKRKVEMASTVSEPREMQRIDLAMPSDQMRLEPLGSLEKLQAIGAAKSKKYPPPGSC